MQRLMVLGDLHIGRAGDYVSLMTGPCGPADPIPAIDPLLAKHIKDAVAAHDTVVINGDIKDNGYAAEYPARDNAVCEQALNWLLGLVQENPQKKFFVSLGNHDGDPEFSFRNRLQQLQPHFTNLAVSDTGFLLGDTLIVHGDLPLRGARPTQRAYTYDAPIPSGKTCAHTLDACLLDNARGDKGQIPFTVTNIVTRELVAMNEALLKNVNQVIYGHTHNFINGVSVKGTTYYNPGPFCYDDPEYVKENARPGKAYYVSGELQGEEVSRLAMRAFPPGVYAAKDAGRHFPQPTGNTVLSR